MLDKVPFGIVMAVSRNLQSLALNLKHCKNGFWKRNAASFTFTPEKIDIPGKKVFLYIVALEGYRLDKGT